MSMPRIRFNNKKRDQSRGHEQAPVAPPSKHKHHRHGRDSKVVAAFCVAATLLAFGILLVTEQIAYTNHEPANIILNSFACLFAVVALGIGGYAKTLQKRHRSRRTRNRLLIGMPIAALTLVVTLMNFHGKMPSAERPPDDAMAIDSPLGPESQELFGPGWYGKTQAKGIEAVVVSFAENAPESRAFNRLLRQRVSYATMTVSNENRPQPAVLLSANVTLMLTTGEELPSLEAKPLLRVESTDEALVRHLAATRTLATGEMAIDIPICVNADFRWERVGAVKLTFDGFVLLVPGRMVTADEKFSLLMKSDAAAKPAEAPPAGSQPAASTNQSAEAWLKDL